MTILNKLFSNNPPTKQPVQDFWVSLMTIMGHPPTRFSRYPTVQVLVNNAAPQRRPSAAIIEFEGPSPLTLMVNRLQGDYAARTLVLNQRVWRAGDRSTLKQPLSDWVDAFLAALGIDLDDSLLKPVCRRVSDS